MLAAWTVLVFGLWGAAQGLLIPSYTSASAAGTIATRARPLSLWGGGGKKNAKAPSPPVPEPVPAAKKGGFNVAGLVQLITMGAGAPMLGEFEKFDDQGRAIFKLEANNFVDGKGEVIQTRAKFFNDGWTDSSENGDALSDKPPGFWQNLASGGRLQSEWDEKNRVSK